MNLQDWYTKTSCELTPEELARVLAKIEVRTRHECWPWHGCARNGGYGNWRSLRLGRNLYPHRIVLALKLGRALHGCALHTCDNRNCCSPYHLYEGTKSDNARDMVARGRYNGGGDGKAKLTQALADQIRDELVKGTVSQAAIARRFGLSPGIIVAIKRNRIWRGVDNRFTNQAARTVTDAIVRETFESLGRSLHRTATQLGLSKTTIWRRLQKYPGKDFT